MAGLGIVSAAYGEQDDVSKALDSTATQWSLQTAYQVMPDYHDDEISPGVTRPAGSTDYIQVRLVAPLVYEKFTMLPRVTLRHYENAQGQSDSYEVILECHAGVFASCIYKDLL